MKPRSLLRLRIAIAILATSGTALAADPKLTLVPAGDPVLATMLLTAEARHAPVLLFDAGDQHAARATAALWSGGRRCFHRPTAPRGLIGLMESITGQVCTEVANPAEHARTLWPQATRVAFFPESDYVALLRASAFAGLVGAALVPIADVSSPEAEILAAWKGASSFFFGSGWKKSSIAGATLIRDDAEALAAVRELDPTFRPTALVITAPADRVGMFSPSSLSLLAPLVAATHRAPLFLIEDNAPDFVESSATAFIDRQALATSHIVLVGDEIGLPSHRVADPVLEGGGPLARGGGKVVRVELFSGIHRDEPQDFAVGRVVAENAVQASFTWARRLHGSPPRKGRPAIVLANADQVFALGETIARATVQDLQNVGVRVRAYYRDEVTPEIAQQSLTQTDVLVWEGHPRDLTLEERGGVAVDSAPRVVVLQGCYTLDRSDPFILIEKGTQAIIATSAAIYSASGSALARAFFDSALHGGNDLGTALRDARNYLLALARLKRDRGHADWRKTWRAAMAFALWGDPTMRLPLDAGKPTLTPARWKSDANELRLTVPKARLRPVTVGPYRAHSAPRSMLSGILWREPNGTRRNLRDLYFTAARPPAGREGVCATDRSWAIATLYAPRSQTLYVLTLPQWHETGRKPGPSEVRFTFQPPGIACP